MDQEQSGAVVEHRAGFVSVIGRPNVGKSTLMNAYMGQKISIVSSKPQTTRRRVLGILTLEQAQIIFVDTPGIHQPHHKLGELMVQTAVETIPNADVILWLVDVSQPATEQDQYIASLIVQYGQGIPVILGLNKSDLVPVQARQDRAKAFLELIQPADSLFFSAIDGENRDLLLEKVIVCLPPGPLLLSRGSGNRSNGTRHCGRTYSRADLVANPSRDSTRRRCDRG